MNIRFCLAIFVHNFTNDLFSLSFRYSPCYNKYAIKKKEKRTSNEKLKKRDSTNFSIWASFIY